MEVSSIPALPQLGIDHQDPGALFTQWHMNLVDDYLAASFGDGSLSFPTFDLRTHLEAASQLRPAKQIKTDTASWSFPNPRATSTCTTPTLSFIDSNPVADVKPKEEAFTLCPKTTFPSDTFLNNYQNSSFENHNYVVNACKRAGGRSLSHSQDHIIAERKRREKLSQKFIALSAIVPGLKKMDKASVLGDAIRYLKQLQERVKLLEEQTSKKTTECVVLVKKSQLFAEDGREKLSDETLPEIEARFCDKSVLIRIHCEKKKGVLEKTVQELEKCHLSVLNSSVMTFGSSALDITILAQMDMEFCMTAKDLVKNLHSAFQLFM